MLNLGTISQVNSFNQLCAEIHALNVRWWTDPRTGERRYRDRGEMLTLVHSELSEAMEGERKKLKDDHLPHRDMAEVELADVLIRMWDYCGGLKYDMDAAIAYHHPLLRDKSPAYMQTYFQQRFFTRAGNKARQIGYMHAAVSKILELEDAGAPSDQVAGAILWLFALVFDYAAIWGYDLTGAVLDKLAYNRTRKDHTNAARLAAGGKQW